MRARSFAEAAVAVSLVGTPLAVRGFWPGAAMWWTTLAVLAMFWLPLAALHFTRRDFEAFGFSWAGWRRAVTTGLVCAALVLPLFALSYWLMWGVVGGREIAWRMDGALIWQIAIQPLVVALPEEIFFRGYVQTLLAQALPGRSRRWLGTHGVAIVLTAALFAVAHVLPGGSAMRLAVFFPGLLFGVLRATTGSIIAPWVVHSLANVLIFVLEGQV